MTNPYQEAVAVDRVVHEPVRLVILTALASCREAEFLFLQRLAGLTQGNLSAHVMRLAEAGLVRVTKERAGRAGCTRVAITPAGRKALERNWERLDGLRRSVAHVNAASDGE
jgi:DNA-binding MarR family transcriptional regulator